MNFKEFLNESKLEQRFSAGLAIIWDGKILLAHTTGRKSNTGWGIPKGGVDKGESKINAAIRETYEELGVKVPMDFNRQERTHLCGNFSSKEIY